MSPEQLPVVIAVFGGVVVLCVLMIVAAVAIRRKRAGRLADAPGAPSVPAAAEPHLRFGPALASMYARSEWQRTRGAKRVLTPEQCFFGYGCVLPNTTLRAALARDWHVRDPASARGEIEDSIQFVEARVLAEAGSDGPPTAGYLDGLAFDIARIANLVRWSGSAGYLDMAAAREASARLGVQAIAHFDGWGSFGEHYLRGLRNFSRSGNRPYDQAVSWLQSAEESPWRQLPWPAGR